MNRTLFSLAIIRTNWSKQKKDHIDNFVPLVGTLINEKRYATISGLNLTTISADFKTKFGLFLPTPPLTIILRRMTKEGFLSLSEGVWTPNYDQIQSLDISRSAREIERKFEALINSLQSFIELETKDKLGPDEIEEGLLCYLKKHDLEILFAANSGSLLPKTKENKKLEFLIGMFIEKAEKSDPNSFNNLVDISIGHALASTILYDEFQIFEGKLKALKIYFDTPWLFDLLGIRGKGKQEIAKELLEMSKQENSETYVLDINVGELVTNFEICLEDFEHKRDPEKASRTYKHCTMNDISENDIHVFLAGINDILSGEYGIILDTVPDHNRTQKYQIDENDLYDFIDNTYNELNIIRDIEEMDRKEKEHIKLLSEKALVPGGNPTVKSKQNTKSKSDSPDRENNTIWRDVHSLSGIYRMRQGVIPRTLKDARAIFVTTNSSLALASRNFEIKENKTKNSIPSCLTDYFLGTLIWLNSPSKAEEIVKKKIIADCYALTQPSQELITAYLAEVDKLKKENKINSDQHLLLRTHHGAYKILNSKTYGDAREFTSATPYEILEQILKDMEISAAQKVRGQLDDKDIEIQKEREAREKAEKEQKETLEKLKTSESRSEKIVSTLERNVHRIADIIVKIGVFGLTVILVWLSIRIQITKGFGIPWIDWGTSILLIVLGITNIVFGFSIIKYVPSITLKLTHKIINLITKD